MAVRRPWHSGLGVESRNCEPCLRLVQRFSILPHGANGPSFQGPGPKPSGGDQPPPNLSASTACQAPMSVSNGLLGRFSRSPYSGPREFYSNGLLLQD